MSPISADLVVPRDLLDEIDEFLDNYADASAEGDPMEYRPNKAMQLLSELRRVRGHE